MQKLKNKIFSCIFVLLAITIIFFTIRSKQTYSQKNQYRTFVVPNRTIQKGEILTLENTSLSRLDIGNGSDLFIQNAEFENFKDMILKDDIFENQPILKLNLINEESIEYKIPPGKRLYILDVSVGPIVSLLKPNDHIDIIAHIDMPGLNKMTETILEGIQLVEVDQIGKLENQENIKYLSFYLNPDEVKILSFIKPYSEFSVVLRNPLDQIQNTTNPMTFNQFIQNEKIRKILNAESFRIISGRTLKPIQKMESYK